MSKSNLYAELCAIAEYATYTEDKKLCVMGIFEKVLTPTLPAAHPRLSFVVTIAGNDSRVVEKVKVKIVSPSGQTIHANDLDINFGENGKATVISNFIALNFSETGVYEFILEKEDKKLATFNLEVIRMKENNGRIISN